MYRKSMCHLAIHLLTILGILLLTGMTIWDSALLPLYQLRVDPEFFADGSLAAVGTAQVAASGQRIVDYYILEAPVAPPPPATPQPVYTLSDYEYDILLRIVAAEAGGEDEDGQLLVANVVLNRMNSDKFPNTITEVVFQRSGKVTQFSPVASGSIWRVKIGEKTYAAVERALMGEDISQGALFFAARKYANQDAMRWFDESLTYLFAHGGHEFFK